MTAKQDRPPKFEDRQRILVEYLEAWSEIEKAAKRISEAMEVVGDPLSLGPKLVCISREVVPDGSGKGYRKRGIKRGVIDQEIPKLLEKHPEGIDARALQRHVQCSLSAARTKLALYAKNNPEKVFVTEHKGTIPAKYLLRKHLSMQVYPSNRQVA